MRKGFALDDERLKNLWVLLRLWGTCIEKWVSHDFFAQYCND